MKASVFEGACWYWGSVIITGGRWNSHLDSPPSNTLMPANMQIPTCHQNYLYLVELSELQGTSQIPAWA